MLGHVKHTHIVGLTPIEIFYTPLKSGDSVFPPYHDKKEKFLMSKKLFFKVEKNIFKTFLKCVWDVFEISKHNVSDVFDTFRASHDHEISTRVFLCGFCMKISENMHFSGPKYLSPHIQVNNFTCTHRMDLIQSALDSPDAGACEKHPHCGCSTPQNFFMAL